MQRSLNYCVGMGRELQRLLNLAPFVYQGIWNPGKVFTSAEGHRRVGLGTWFLLLFTTLVISSANGTVCTSYTRCLSYMKCCWLGLWKNLATDLDFSFGLHVFVLKELEACVSSQESHLEGILNSPQKNTKACKIRL